MIYLKNFKQYISLILIVLLLTGCKPENNKTTEIQKKDKAPSSISDFSQGLQGILNEIEKIEKILDDSDIKMNEEKIKNNTNSDKENNEEKEGEKQKKTSIEEKKQNKLLEIWIEIDKNIEDIHNKWNLYGVEGMRKGIGLNPKDKLEEKLNLLTKAIEERDIINIYQYGSLTMLKLEPIFNLYKDEIKGNTNKIKYYIYQSYLNAMEGKSIKAQTLLEELDESLNQTRVKLEKDDEKIKIFDRLKLSIESMKIGLKENSPKIYRIKKEIIIRNINELEK